MQHHIQNIIKKYNLIPHPEGGYYREIFRSKTQITSPAVNKKRTTATHIYFFLLEKQISKFHKVVHDEIWSFYQGDALKVIIFEGETAKETIIGHRQKDGYTVIIPGGCYQAAESIGEYSLVGCTVAPGFEFEDMSFLYQDESNKSKLLKSHPEYKKFI